MTTFSSRALVLLISGCLGMQLGADTFYQYRSWEGLKSGKEGAMWLVSTTNPERVAETIPKKIPGGLHFEFIADGKLSVSAGVVKIDKVGKTAHVVVTDNKSRHIKVKKVTFGQLEEGGTLELNVQDDCVIEGDMSQKGILVHRHTGFVEDKNEEEAIPLASTKDLQKNMLDNIKKLNDQIEQALHAALTEFDKSWQSIRQAFDDFDVARNAFHSHINNHDSVDAVK